MRFLILTQYYPPEVGAAQARLSAFARELVREGHEVEVITAFPNYPSGRLADSDLGRMVRRERVDGIQVRRVWHFAATGAGVRRLGSYLTFSATGLVAALSAKRADVVFVESPPLFLGLAGWLATQRSKAAFVLNISDLWPDSVRDVGVIGEGPILQAAEGLERWLYARATAVTAVTEGIRERLIQVKGVAPGKVLFLPNGVDLAMLKPLAAPAPELSRPQVLYTGNLGLAQALDTVVRSGPEIPGVDIVLVGAGSAEASLKQLVVSQGSDNVRFMAPVSPNEISALYHGALAGLVSLRDSELMRGARPAKTLAIMACGRPVIYAGRGEGADLVLRADAGIVVPPEQPSALARAIADLANDPERAVRLGANGRRYVEAHCSWSALTASWLDQLTAILG